MYYVVLLLLDKEDAKVDIENLLGERKEGGDKKVPKIYVAGGEDGGGEVRGNGRETDDEDDPEAAVAGEAGQGGIVEVCALELGGFATEGVHEGEPRADCRS